MASMIDTAAAFFDDDAGIVQHGKSFRVVGRKASPIVTAFSYDTPIAVRSDDGNNVKITRKKYSTTTSTHVGSIKRAAETRGYVPDPSYVDDEWVMYHKS